MLGNLGGQHISPLRFDLTIPVIYILGCALFVQFPDESFYVCQLCQLVPLQRYTKSLSTLQRSSLVEKSRQKPQERMSVLSDVSGLFILSQYLVVGLLSTVSSMSIWQVLKRSSYDTEPMLKACGISIAQGFTQVAGRVLQAPKVSHNQLLHILFSHRLCL